MGFLDFFSFHFFLLDSPSAWAGSPWKESRGGFCPPHQPKDIWRATGFRNQDFSASLMNFLSSSFHTFRRTSSLLVFQDTREGCCGGPEGVVRPVWESTVLRETWEWIVNWNDKCYGEVLVSCNSNNLNNISLIITLTGAQCTYFLMMKPRLSQQCLTILLINSSTNPSNSSYSNGKCD